MPRLIEAAGFVEVEILAGGDVVAGAPQQSSAADFGTRGAGIRARRPEAPALAQEGPDH
jgi:hypothetical protein